MTTDQKFGPQTAEVERLLAVLRTVTPEEQRACNRAWARVPDDVWYRSMTRAGDVSRNSGPLRHDEWDAVCDAFGPSVAPPVGVYLMYLDAVWALLVRDQIDREDFEVIVGPVVEVFGRCWEEEA